MRIDVMTIFPEMFHSPLNVSILKRAIEKGLLEVGLTDFRDYATDKHRRVDDYPFGGGAGMVLKPEPIFRAWSAIREKVPEGIASRTILLCPQGKVFNQDLAWELSREEHLILICGHYEGVDERVRIRLADDAISIGDYILTGGELGALVVIDAVARLLPGVLGDEYSSQEETFSDGLLEYPQYTRPREYCGMEVPEILLSGHHAEIRKWRRLQSLLRTKELRPDLLEKANLSPEEKKFLDL
ncbi:MAG: tRNA (guanosine(37)-N1)-methyltransferase TrmD [Clostridia bacterium]|jgi:tRNA (guanine37-N1)-methyltransferase|nr:tRNA (guanosine(37)-N1)-methyltransferase TrmD [Clostridia bacterium]